MDLNEATPLHSIDRLCLGSSMMTVLRVAEKRWIEPYAGNARAEEPDAKA